MSSTQDCTYPAFLRVRVDYIVDGGGRISWLLHPNFIEPGPYVFQLQVGETGTNVATDWANVGDPVTDTFYVIDTEKRLYGKTADLHYRLQLDTGLGKTYYSEPANVLGNLEVRDWNLAQEITRKEQLRHSALASPNGYLLIAKRHGPLCSVCLDPLTKEPTTSNCDSCFGTGFEGGYFPAVPNVFCDINFAPTREALTAQTGTDKQETAQGRFTAVPQVKDRDIWINKTTDDRHYIHGIAISAHARGVPVVYTCQLRKAPYTDTIYSIKMPN